MERRVLIAIFLSFLVLYSYQAFFVKPTPKPDGSTATTSAADAAASPAAASTAAAASVPDTADLGGSLARRRHRRARIRVETPNVIAVFTNRGARLKSWRLKHYRDSRANRSSSSPTTSPDTAVAVFACAAGRPRTTATPERRAVCRERRARRSHVVSRRPGRVRVSGQRGTDVDQGVHARPGRLHADLRAAVAQNGDRVAPDHGMGTRPRRQRFADRPVRREARGAVSRPRAKSRGSGRGDREAADHDGDFEYVGIDDHYFMSVALKPGAGEGHLPAARRFPPARLKGCRRATWWPTRSSRRLGRAADVLHRSEGFRHAGQRSIATSSKAINFGMFSVLVVPLLRSLNWIYGYVGNYGWSILMLTVFINMVLFPLNHKSVVSMRKMQEIQPEAKAIQERYAKLKATDPGEAEDEPGDDGALPRAGREPRQRLHSDSADPAGVPRVLRAADHRHRAARRAVLRLDSRPVAAGSYYVHAGARRPRRRSGSSG